MRYLLLVMLALPSTFTKFAWAVEAQLPPTFSPAIECLKLAMNEPNVFKSDKSYDRSTAEWSAMRLCAGTTQAEAPISCFKLVLGDSEILKRVKGKYLGATEEDALRLCAGTSDAEAPIACIKTATNDPDTFKKIKSLNAGVADEGILRLCTSHFYNGRRLSGP